MEIAYDLAEGGAAQVWLSARTPPNIVLRTGIGATGYGRGLEPLVGQLGELGDGGKEAKRAAKAIARELRDPA